MFQNFLLSYTRSQRRGLILLFLIAFVLQGVCFFFHYDKYDHNSYDDEKWLAMEQYVDSAIAAAHKENVSRKYFFNPNFITDYKGYSLGMSVSEIDRLHSFRQKGLYVNSAAEFQKVTAVSDSLLRSFEDQFKFPEWTQRKKSSKVFTRKVEKAIVKSDINHASKDELIKVYGIGPALSERILKFRETLGGFVHIDQVGDVWGLSPEVVLEMNRYFEVRQIPEVRKIDINSASVRELSAFPYFRYQLAKEIVTYRSMHGPIRNAEDLAKIKNFPADKIHIIAVYLEL